jgi:DNA-binding transcriptional MerR regulator
MSNLLTMSEASELLGVSTKTIRLQEKEPTVG